jgi:hypothetical protein
LKDRGSPRPPNHLPRTERRNLIKKFAVGVVLLAALGAACAKATDGPVPDADENAIKAASAAAAEAYVGSLEQLAVGSIRASLKAQADSYVGSLGQSAYLGSQNA